MTGGRVHSTTNDAPLRGVSSGPSLRSINAPQTHEQSLKTVRSTFPSPPYFQVMPDDSYFVPSLYSQIWWALPSGISTNEADRNAGLISDVGTRRSDNT